MSTTSQAARETAVRILTPAWFRPILEGRTGPARERATWARDALTIPAGAPNADLIRAAYAIVAATRTEYWYRNQLVTWQLPWQEEHSVTPALHEQRIGLSRADLITGYGAGAVAVEIKTTHDIPDRLHGQLTSYRRVLPRTMLVTAAGDEHRLTRGLPSAAGITVMHPSGECEVKRPPVPYCSDLDTSAIMATLRAGEARRALVACGVTPPGKLPVTRLRAALDQLASGVDPAALSRAAQAELMDRAAQVLWCLAGVPPELAGVMQAAAPTRPQHARLVAWLAQVDGVPA